MDMPDPGRFGLEPGIVVEPIPGGERLIVWIPRGIGQQSSEWERVGTLANAAVESRGDLRQPLRPRAWHESEVHGKFLQAGSVSGPTTRIDSGYTRAASRSGPSDLGRRGRCWSGRRTKLATWTPNEFVPAGRAAIASSGWGETSFWSAGSAVSGPRPASVAEENPRVLAEQRLVDARHAQDPRRLATALADLASVQVSANDGGPRRRSSNRLWNSSKISMTQPPRAISFAD